MEIKAQFYKTLWGSGLKCNVPQVKFIQLINNSELSNFYLVLMLVLKQLDFLGDPVMLHLLIQRKKFNVNNIDNLPEERLKEICKECSISTNRRSVVSVFLFRG